MRLLTLLSVPWPISVEIKLSGINNYLRQEQCHQSSTNTVNGLRLLFGREFWEFWISGSNLYRRFWDRRRFHSKIAKFSHRLLFCVPAEGSPWNWVPALGPEN